MCENVPLQELLPLKELPNVVTLLATDPLMITLLRDWMEIQLRRAITWLPCNGFKNLSVRYRSNESIEMA